jgi:hypothetical protein
MMPGGARWYTGLDPQSVAAIQETSALLCKHGLLRRQTTPVND